MKSICDELHDLVSFVQFKKRENTHGGVSLLVKLQAIILVQLPHSNQLNCRIHQ